MFTPSTTPPPPCGVFPVFTLTTPYLEQPTTTTQQFAPTLGQPALVLVQVASAFAFGQPVGQQLKAGVGTGNHPVNESEIEALMPQLRHSDYYTKPTIEELAAKERAEPGYCSRVKDFVLGRHGAGYIEFLGETDIRWVDLDSVIQFNQEKVNLKTTRNEIEFNGTAEITNLCDLKFSHEEMRCHNVQSQLIKRLEEYKKYLKDLGMEFVSYDPIKGELKYRVKYFSWFGYIVFKEKVKVGLGRRIKNLVRKIKKMIYKFNI